MILQMTKTKPALIRITSMQSLFYPKTPNPIQTSKLLFQITKHKILASQTSKQNAITRMQASHQLVEPAKGKQQVSKTHQTATFSA